MPIISSKELRNRVEKLWQQGKLHKAWLNNEALFPLILNLPTPPASELLHQFSSIQSAISVLKQESLKHGYTLTYKTINHQKLGTQTLPDTIVFEQEQDLLRYLNKNAEFILFKQLCDVTLNQYPSLHSWIMRYPFKITEFSDVWQHLLTICAYFIAHPLPNCYIRQLDIQGIDSKFIESHKAILTELLDIILPETARFATITGLANHGFERRYGLRYDLPTCRFRILDTRLALDGLTDLTVTIPELKILNLNIKTVFIVENKITGLAFPEFPDAIVIFGLGYSVDILADIPMLKNATVYYWGDLDTHGFAILSRLRGYYPNTISFLMDEQTLKKFRYLSGTESKTVETIPDYLKPEELSVFLHLKNTSLRLEQERISFKVLHEYLNKL
jgi:hypothetical protein